MSSEKTIPHSEAATKFNKDVERVNWHDETLWFVRAKRDRSAHQIADWELLRETASQIKLNVLSNIHDYLVEFEANAQRNGIIVHWAADAKEHNEIVHSIMAKHDVKQMVKSKSMLTEECHLNDYLAEKGIEVIDSDLGEYIVQLRKEPPSHIVLPAIHLKKEDVSETFHEHLGTEKGNFNPQYLTESARHSLRNTFLTRKVALTGVNFAVAETGEFVVCTNEGNADMGAHLADVHIACMGFEKLIPKREHLGVFLRLLARSATGQPITTFSSHFKKPRDGKEMHIVIVDNGRSTQLGREDFRNSLKCIRCGACMNTCPVYRRSGGHSYHNAVAGPIGSILAPNLDMSKNADLPFASTLCGSCTNVCPVKIDIHDQLYKWRQVLVKEGHTPTAKTVAMKTMATVLANPTVFNIAGKSGRFVMKNIPGMVNNKMNKWYDQREMPDVPEESLENGTRKIRENLKKKEMSSKGEILKRIKANQPDLVSELPDLKLLGSEQFDVIETYKTVLKGIGGDPVEVANYDEIINYIKSNYNLEKRLITTLPELSEIASLDWKTVDPHSLQDVELTVIKAHFGVAENSGLWVTDDILGQRVAPFIAQYLAIVVHKKDLVPTMQQAYDRIGHMEYGFGTFIAGPSKTADIEQSLVLGAHGARGLIVFLLD